jgi:MFS family permease
MENSRTKPGSDQASSGWGALLRGRNGVLCLALAGGVMLHAINVYVTITILPSVVEDIGGAAYYAWNTTLFILASIVGSAVSSNILARLGPRTGYRLAILVFLSGAAICAVAPNMPVLLTGRAIQGLGGGILFALSYAMIRIVFDEHLWPRAMAIVSSMWGAATLAGPALGGVFAEFDMWRGAFWGLLIVGAPYLLLTERILPKKDAKRTDMTAVAWLQICFLTLTVMLISVGSLSSALAINLVGLAAAAILIAALIFMERRRTLRLLPRGSFDPGGSLSILYAVMALLVIGMQTEIFVPYFLQAMHDLSPLVAGYLAALMAAGWAISAILFSGLNGPGARRAVMLGPMIVTLALLALVVVLPAVSPADDIGLFMIAAGLTAVGFGIGLAWPHLLARVLVVAPKDEEDKASSGITTLQLFATALGAALAGLVANANGFDGSGTVAGAKDAAFWLFASFALAPAMATILSILVARDMKMAKNSPQTNESRRLRSESNPTARP